MVNIVFVHGFAASRLHWLDYVKVAEERGFICHAMDLLGHGDGMKPQKAAGFEIETMYRDFADKCDEISKNTKVVFVGHSLGCYLILRYAFHNPEKIAKIVLMSPMISRKQIIAKLVLLMEYPKFGSVVLGLTPQFIVKKIIQFDKINTAGLSPQMLLQTVLDYKRADPRIMHIGNTIEDISSKLKYISNQVLVIWGNKDNSLDVTYFDIVINQIPNAKSYMINNGGHVINLTHTREIIEQIFGFILNAAG